MVILLEKFRNMIEQKENNKTNEKREEIFQSNILHKYNYLLKNGDKVFLLLHSLSLFLNNI
jgi:hypothetical protein